MVVNPQTENGYTKIANEIMDALGRTRIPGEARQVLDVIIRKTYGWGKKKDTISTSQFMELTGLNKGTIHRIRKRLLYTNLITVYKNDDTQVLSYSFQKDYTKWKPLLYTKKGIPKNATNCIQKSAQTVPQITPHNINKENIQKKGARLFEEFDYFKNEPFKSAFKNYLDMRKILKKPMTEHAQELTLKQLHDHPIDTAIKMLEQSIIRSWAGIFPLKEQKEVKYS